MNLRKILLALVCVFGAVAALAQTKVGLCITGEINYRQRGSFNDAVVEAINQVDGYTAVENVFPSALDREEAKDYKKIAAEGRSKGVKYVLMADVAFVNTETQEIKIAGRLIDVRTAGVEKTSEATGPGKTLGDKQKVAVKLVNGLLGASGTDASQTSGRPSQSTSPDGETFTVNGVSFTMIKVPGGTFMMGSDSAEAYNNEKPPHSESVSTFYIGQTEVTQGLWTAVMGSNPSHFLGDYNRPVEQVSWDDCQIFLRKLNELTGRNFRLPTEVEWEYAARGAKPLPGYKYSGSNDINSVAWYDGNSGRTTHPVGQKTPNELGLYDMSGNVWEWCSDYYSSNYNSPRNSSNRVFRGGGWLNSPVDCRVAYRYGLTPGFRNIDLGLRLAL